MSEIKNFSIDRISIGLNNPTFIIAEIGMSHDGSLGYAYSMIDAVAKTNYTTALSRTVAEPITISGTGIISLCQASFGSPKRSCLTQNACIFSGTTPKGGFSPNSYISLLLVLLLIVTYCLPK